MGDLKVEVLWQESGMRKTSKAAVDKKAGTAWTPVKSLQAAHGRAQHRAASSRSPSASRPTGGSYQIDDLYVDPFMRR